MCRYLTPQNKLPMDYTTKGLNELSKQLDNLKELPDLKQTT